ncbi:hypothetical protein V8G54_028304 [Vigna mungo]|uniref:Myb-like domain-containing protein n=1 Tax=Vigna mungo TaxID=3915 RepID=A0AAQ3RI15_VIGMU
MILVEVTFVLKKGDIYGYKIFGIVGDNIYIPFVLTSSRIKFTFITIVDTDKRYTPKYSWNKGRGETLSKSCGVKEIAVDKMKAQTGLLRPDYAAICQDYAAIRQDLQEIIRMLGSRGHNHDDQHWDRATQRKEESRFTRFRRKKKKCVGHIVAWREVLGIGSGPRRLKKRIGAMVWRFGEQNRGTTVEGVARQVGGLSEPFGGKREMKIYDDDVLDASGSAGAFCCTIIESLILVNEIVVVEADCSVARSSYQHWNIITQNCVALDVQRNLTQCRRKWHALLFDYDRFKRATTVGGKLSPNFDYQLFVTVERVVRAREEWGIADPESDTEAWNDALDDATVEIGSKRKGQRSTSTAIKKNMRKNHSFRGGIETVKVVDVATPTKERELLEALKDIGKEVTKMLKVNRIREERKIVEEDLPPPKPPNLKLQVVANG